MFTKRRRNVVRIVLMSIILCGMIFPGLGTGVAHASDCPFGGSGTDADPYIIDSASDLVWLSANFGDPYYCRSYLQTADIDMTGIAFEPIGSGADNQHKLMRTYDGNGRTISNLTINSDRDYVGLFGVVEGGRVKNVTLQNINVRSTTAGASVGALAGMANSVGIYSLENCSVIGTNIVEGAATGIPSVGGLVGRSANNHIRNCYYAGTVKSNTASSLVGGIAGYGGNAADSIIEKCYFAGSITGALGATTGGIVGSNVASVSGNYFLNTATSGGIGSPASNTGAVPTTDADLKKSSTFVGWDLASVWFIDENNAYPRLRASAPLARDIGVDLTDAVSDSVLVGRVSPGYTVRVYGSLSGATLLGSAVVAPGNTSVAIDVGKLARPTGSVYVSVETTARTEGPRAAKGYNLLTLPIIESFEHDGNMPGGWASDSVSGALAWSFVTADGTSDPSTAPYLETYMAKLNCYDNESGESRLRMDSGIGLPTGSTYTLSFWMYHDADYADCQDQLQVQVSLDGGFWIAVGDPILRLAGSGWELHEFNLDSCIGSDDVRVGFLGTSCYGNNIYIDDVEIRGTVVDISAPALVGNLTFTDPTGAVNNGKTQVNLGAPSVPGNTFRYLISPNSDAVSTPLVGYDASAWTTVVNGNLITVANGKHIGVAEVDGTNKVVQFKDAVAVMVNEYSLSYAAELHGSISGAASQSVNQGSNGTTVTAVAASGYHFVGWSDGNKVAERTDLTVVANISVTASFEQNHALTVSGITAQDKPYDGSTNAILDTSHAVLNGAVEGEAVTLVTTGTSGSFSDPDVGPGKTVTVSGLTLGGACAGNYSLEQPTTTAAISVRQVLVGSVTIANKPYDGNTAATITGATLTGRVGAEDVSIDCSAAVATFDSSQFGNNKSVSVTGLKLGGAAKDNYILTSGSFTTVGTITSLGTATTPTAAATTNVGTIKKDAIITLSAEGGATIYYTTALNGAAPAPSALSSSVLNGGAITYPALTYGDVLNIQAYAAVPGKVDSAVATLSYTVQSRTELTLTGITLSNRDYDGTTNAIADFTNAALSGVLGTDGVTLSGTPSASFLTAGAADGKTVTVSGYALTGADADYYALNTTLAPKANITKKALTLGAITIGEKTYDGTNSATINSILISSGIVGSEDVSVNVPLASATYDAGAAVGTGKVVSVSGIQLTGIDSANYSISSTGTSSGNITAKAVSVDSVTIANKPYDGNTAATITGATLTGRVGAEDVSIDCSAAVATFDSSQFGNNKSVSVTGLKLGGAAKDNYILTSGSFTTVGTITSLGTATTPTAAATTNVGTIKKDATITLSAEGGATVYYTTALNDVASAPSALSSSVLSGGAITYPPLTYGNVLNIQAYAAVPGKVDSAVATMSYTVQSRTELTLTGITLSNRDYDGSTNAIADFTNAALSGVLGTDGVTLSGTPSASFLTAGAADGKVVIVSGYALTGADADYYTLNTTLAPKANITKKALTLGAITIGEKTYDGTNSATINSILISSGIVGSEDVSVNVPLASATYDAGAAVGTGKVVSVSGIQLTGIDSANYSISSTGTCSGDITAKAVSVDSVTIASKPYDGDTAATITGAALTGKVGADDVTIDCSAAVATFDNSQFGNNKSVSVTGLKLGGAAKDNYTLSSGSFTTVGTITSLGTATTPTAAATTNVGTIKKDATITLSAEGGATIYYTTALNGAAPAPSALSSSVLNGGAIAYPALTYGDVLNIQAYAAVPGKVDSAVATLSYTVQSRTELTLTGITLSNRDYDGTTNAIADFTNAALSGVLGTDEVTLSGTPSASFLTAGAADGKTVTVSGYALTGADADYYILNTTLAPKANITKRTLTPSATASDKVYDGTTAGSGSISLDEISGDDVTASGTFAFTNQAVGPGKAVNVTAITLSGGADKDNYTLGINSASTTADITARPVMIGLVTAENKTYDGNRDATGTITLSGVVPGDTVSAGGIFSFGDKAVASDKPVAVTGIALAGADSANYAIATTTGSATASITAKSLTPTATAINREYDGAVSASGTVSASEIVSGDQVTLSGTFAFATKAAVDGKTVSVTAIVLSGDDADNYTLASTSITTTGSISRKTLTPSVTASDKVYDGTVAGSGSIALDIVSGDDVTASGTFAFTTQAVGPGKTVNVTTITLSGGADKDNYTLGINSASTTADITARPVMIDLVTAENKTYDGTRDATGTITLSGVLGLDQVTASGTFTYDTASVGIGKTVTVADITLGGAGAANYSVDASATTTGAINKKAVTVAAIAQSKVYGNTDPELTYSGALLGSDVFTGALTRAPGEDADVYAIQQGTLDADNYDLTFTPATLTITERPISATGITVANRYYDGTTVATLRTTGAGLTGQVDGDDVVLVVTGAVGAFADARVEANKVVTVSGLSLSGDDAGNYLLNTYTTTATILEEEEATPPTPPTPPAPPAPPIPPTVEIIVNGEVQGESATATTTTEDNHTVTTVVVDPEKLDERLQREGNGSTVVIPVNNGSDVVVGQLNGQTVKNMEAKEAVLEIRTGNVSYTLPASQINIDSVSAQIGEEVQLQDIKVSVAISTPSEDTARVVQDTANRNSYQVVVRPVEFEITCTSGDKTVDVSKFNGYVERTVAIPDGIDPSKITTGIVLNNDGTFSHVPTSIVVIDGKYYAKINSLTNSTYSVIWNPITFPDMVGHWAAGPVTDMASRLVMVGDSSESFGANRAITRGEFAATIVKALGLRPGTGDSPFVDVAADHEYYGYILTAYEYGFMGGYPGNTFLPERQITREEAMSIVVSTMKVTGLQSGLQTGESAALLATYADSGKVSGWARGVVATCLKSGIIGGRPGLLISPKDSITRAEAAAIMQRLLRKSGLI